MWPSAPKPMLCATPSCKMPLRPQRSLWVIPGGSWCGNRARSRSFALWWKHPQNSCAKNMPNGSQIHSENKDTRRHKTQFFPLNFRKTSKKLAFFRNRRLYLFFYLQKAGYYVIVMQENIVYFYMTEKVPMQPLLLCIGTLSIINSQIIAKMKGNHL